MSKDTNDARGFDDDFPLPGTEGFDATVAEQAAARAAAVEQKYVNKSGGDGKSDDTVEGASSSDRKEPPGSAAPDARYVEFLEQRLATLEGGASGKAEPEPEPEPFNYEEAEAARAKALLDDDVAAAAKIGAEINQAVREEALREARRELGSVEENANRRSLAQTEVARAERQYPQLDQSSPHFDQKLLNETRETLEAFMATGKYAPDEAVRRAVGMVARANGVAPAEGGALADVASGGGRSVAEERLAMARGKLDDAVRQPPATTAAGRGSREGGLSLDDLLSMPDEDFDSLTEAQKARLRGDAVS